jgi:cysteine synthase
VTETVAVPTAPAHSPDIGMVTEVVDAGARDRSIERFRQQRILLPTFAQLRDPETIPAAVRAALASVDPDVPDARNLFRVHWRNRLGTAEWSSVPEHLELPPALTGVPARIVLALGNRFPMIGAHKVLAAYACLAPRVVTGRFDPTVHRAIWPSTGNYARGGVAISRIMGCRGVAVLPAGMSQERFDWLQRWTADPARDIIRTPGTESNVREIYDACAVLALDPTNVVINQFCEFPNYLGHRTVTGPALAEVFDELTRHRPGRLAAFVAATGSAGTIGAGDHLKAHYGAEIVAAEALECPTMFENGFGEHNIQGIGDKHIPLIHNVHNTDVVTAISDRVTDQLDVLFQTDEGRAFLVEDLGLDPELVDQLRHLGYSAICNLVSAIRYAHHRHLGPDDVVMTVATDGSELYDSGRPGIMARDFPDGFDRTAAAITYGRHLGDPAGHALLELDEREHRRIFNLGYFTWVEQLGLSVEDFEARRPQSWWDDLVPAVAAWDELITDFNQRTGVDPASLGDT